MIVKDKKIVKKFLKQNLTDSAPTAGRLVQRLSVKLTGVGLSVDWLHPKTVQEGLTNEATFELLEYSSLQPIGFRLQFKQTRPCLWATRVVDQN